MHDCLKEQRKEKKDEKNKTKRIQEWNEWTNKRTVNAMKEKRRSTHTFKLRHTMETRNHTKYYKMRIFKCWKQESHSSSSGGTLEKPKWMECWTILWSTCTLSHTHKRSNRCLNAFSCNFLSPTRCLKFHFIFHRCPRRCILYDKINFNKIIHHSCWRSDQRTITHTKKSNLFNRTF